MNLRDVARGYIADGLAPIPVPYRQKAPVITEWQTLRLADADLPTYFNGQPSNIGVLLGEPSGNRVDTDLDAPEALQLASVFLPATGRVFGRASKPRSHWLAEAQR